MDAAALAQRLEELEAFRIKLSSRVRELQEELQQEQRRLHQHEGAVAALRDISKGIDARS